MITETEAKTKMCPILEARSHLRDGATSRLQTCKGSVCMMWRWESTSKMLPEQRSDAHGFCGLAGKS